MSPTPSLDRNMPILLVDDLPTMRRVVKNCLRQLGFENIVEAETPDVALEQLQTNEFSFVISEWNMPTMSGAALIEAARETMPGKEVPFLMVTAEAQRKAVAEAEAKGICSYIVKPFTAQLLKQKMETLLSSSAQNSSK